jgi:uncharacterized membrane protein
MYTSRQNYNVGSHPIIGIIMFLFVFAIIAIIISSMILFFAENVGFLAIFLGLFILYISYDEKTQFHTMTFKECSGYTIGSLLISLGVTFIIFNGISFQNFITLF